MRYRIQPQEVAIPDDDPFKHDLLERREPADVITAVLRSVDGPCVLAVDAPWGAGKTTFLRMLSHHLRNQEFPVIEFNAWETDFAGDPFVALSEELTAGLRAYAAATQGDGFNRVKLYKLRQVATEVLRRAAPGAIRVATAGILDVSPLLEKEVGQALASYAKQRLSAYLDTRASVQTFRTSLKELATELADANHGLPLIVLIDELDRCRPSYAVELLETAKHLFSVDRVVFVLAVNRSELAHSIRAVYGGEFDALGYLRRFIDIDFRLPEAEREPFMDALLQSTGIEDYFKNRPAGSIRGDDYGSVREWLLTFFASSSLSLRRIAQSIHRLGLVFASLRKDQRSLATAATIALVMRTLEPDLFWRFTRGDVEDREAARVMLGRVPGLSDHHSALLKAILIVAALEIEHADRYARDAEPSPFLAEYRGAARKAKEAADHSDPAALRAMVVVDTVDSLMADQLRGVGLGFREAARRLELLSPSLVDDDGQRSDGGRDG